MRIRGFWHTWGVLLALLPGRALLAQQLLPSPGPRTCATQLAQAGQQAQLLRQVAGYSPAPRRPTGPGAQPQQTAATTYTLPVVLHIIHSGEAVGTGANISQAQVQSQLDVLNEDYRNQNADGALVPAAFQGLRADAQFQFQLATVGPDCQPLPEPGIDRIDRTARNWDAPPYGSRTDLAYIENVIKPQTSWNPEQYVNIWVLPLGGGLLGYAQFPDNAAGLAGLPALGGQPATDGVVVTYAAVGRTGTLLSTFNRGRTLTHELGHYLGLLHVWGDDEAAADVCSGSDYVADTPNQGIYNFGCPTYPHVSCTNGPAGDLFMDFMDYVDDGCMGLFSAGQKDRMQAVMAAGTARRSALPSSPALRPVLPLAARTDGPACAGSTVTLHASGPPAGASYLWSGPSSFSSTQQNPVLPAVSGAVAGQYTVTATAPGYACPATATATLVVSGEVPRLTATALLPCPGTPVTLSAVNYPSAAAPGATYAWSLVRGDGLPPTGLAAPALTVAPTRPSTYRLTVSTAGCALSDTIRLALAISTWTGAAGTGSWFDAGNWDSGCLPTRYTDAIIPAGLSTPYPTISGGTAEVHTLTQQGDLFMTGGELALYGHHLGNLRWTQQGGTVAVRGTGYQVLHPGTYANLLIAGPGTKLFLVGPDQLTQSLTMQQGLLLASLALGPTATITETDSSYAIGDLQTTRPLRAGPNTFGGLGLVLTPAAASAEPITVWRSSSGVGPRPTGGSTITRSFRVQSLSNQAIPGGALAFSYFPHELNGLPADQLTLFRSADQGTTWTDQGATQRMAGTVARSYLPTLAGTWTLGNAAVPSATTYVPPTLSAYPIPFGPEGLTVSVSTAAAGPVAVQVLDVLGRVVFDQPVLSVEVGSSTFQLPALGALAPGRYVLLLQQGTRQIRLQVVRQ